MRAKRAIAVARLILIKAARRFARLAQILRCAERLAQDDKSN
jgi:hypothetical protein